MSDWTKSYACASRAHCVACRSRGEDGRLFRESVGVGDFECPHGISWGAAAAVLVVPSPISQIRTGAEAQALIEEHCTGCAHERIHDYGAPGCTLVSGCCGSQSPLAFKKYVESGAPCPHPDGDKWATTKLSILNQSVGHRTHEQMQDRIDICNMCPLQTVQHETQLGCFLISHIEFRERLESGSPCPHPEGSRWRTPEGYPL